MMDFVKFEMNACLLLKEIVEGAKNTQYNKYTSIYIYIYVEEQVREVH